MAGFLTRFLLYYDLPKPIGSVALVACTTVFFIKLTAAGTVWDFHPIPSLTFFNPQKLSPRKSTAKVINNFELVHINYYNTKKARQHTLSRLFYQNID